MFLLMLLIFILLFVVSFEIFKKDLFSPCILVCAMYCISGFCALYNYEIWGLNKYNWQTSLIIISGILTFMIVSLIVYTIYKKRNCQDDCIIEKYKNIYHFPLIIHAFVFFICILTIVWKLYDIVKVANLYGFSSSLSNMIGRYRSIVSYSSSNINYDPPFLLNQLGKIVTAISYLYLYFIINNIYNKDTKKNNVIYCIYLILFFIYSILTGGRMPLLKLSAAGIFFCFCFSNRKNNWKKNISFKYIKIGIICLLICFTSFYALHWTLGRTKNFKPDYYVTMYAGGSLKLFDMYIDNPKDKTDIFGKETFYNINIILNKIGLSENDYIKHLEFRRYEGVYLGNVYTPFRRYYADFGMIGVIILTAIFSLIVNLFYLKMINKISKSNKNDLWMICYGLIIYILFLYSIDDQFFTVICSINYISLYILIIVFYKIFINMNTVDYSYDRGKSKK